MSRGAPGAPELVPSGAHDLLVNILLPPSCPGDVNADGSIGLGDLLAVLSAWGPCAGCPEDLDDDDVVGFVDLLTVLGSWGPCPAS